MGAHGVLDGLGLLAVPGEHDALLVQEVRGVVVRAHGQGDVGHGPLDVVELLVETLWCHGVSSPDKTVFDSESRGATV
ncbi:hypothetical protein GCM10010339_58140 [Streptomyces alanosinicus]|uniref:Uncharacterized protein n=1 Tax=Streptomyces alanosinicus TaxID=68171 RepID=A0A918YN95_9ACTN|nr:hypothetical protein GCM10010339_58140 [Streptomyces alanosinicus]